MDIILSFDQQDMKKKTAIAVGYFDGMHLGHRELIRKMCRYAEEKDLLPMILTFNMSELRAEGKGKKDLFLREHNMALAEELGVEVFADIPFGLICDMLPDEFCKTVLSGENSLSAAAVFCGEDFRFGKNRIGTVTDLYDCGEHLGFSVIAIDGVQIDGETVSTSKIKEAVTSGDIEKANRMLGTPYVISGEVIHGNHLARGMGFPTANILLREGIVSPKKGVYITETNIKGERYRSITNIGTRPTVTKDVISTAETHILDFDKDIYGENIEVFFYKFVRPEHKFDSAETLKQIVHANIALARDYKIDIC